MVWLEQTLNILIWWQLNYCIDNIISYLVHDKKNTHTHTHTHTNRDFFIVIFFYYHESWFFLTALRNAPYHLLLLKDSESDKNVRRSVLYLALRAFTCFWPGVRPILGSPFSEYLRRPFGEWRQGYASRPVLLISRGCVIRGFDGALPLSETQKKNQEEHHYR